jgi:hypothetical protein
MPRVNHRDRLVLLEILHFALVLLGLLHCLERAQVAALAGGGIFLAGV